MLSDFGTIFLFIVAAIVLLMVILGVARLLRPHRPNDEKLTTYESGEDPVGNANVPFNVRFYVIAIIFVLFEVELVFLFPWATVFADASLMKETNGLWGWFALAEMLVFVGLLVLGLVYAWGKGYLEWAKPIPQIPTIDSQVPNSLYENINKKYGK